MDNLNIFLWPLVILSIFFLISFFLSLSETALIAVSKIRLRNLMNKGIKNAKIAHKLVLRLDRLIATILVGNNFVNIGISAIGTAIFIYFFGQKWGVLLSTLVISFLVLVFLEITPKIFASQHPDKVSLIVARPIDFLISLLRPLVTVFMNIGEFVIKVCGGEVKRRQPLVTEEEIKVMIEVGKEEGAVSDDERKMLHRIFKFGDTLVKEVMVPKEKIVAIDVSAKVDELLKVVTERGYSRIPVYEGSADNIVGIAYARNLLKIRHFNKIHIKDIIHPAYFITETKRVIDLLRDFQRMKLQIAIVIDKDKKPKGLVTLEDLIEEIVGEIEEEV